MVNTGRNRSYWAAFAWVSRRTAPLEAFLEPATRPVFDSMWKVLAAG